MAIYRLPNGTQVELSLDEVVRLANMGDPRSSGDPTAQLTASQYATYEAVRDEKVVTITWVAHKLGITSGAASQRLLTLSRLGLLKRAGLGRYEVY